MFLHQRSFSHGGALTKKGEKRVNYERMVNSSGDAVAVLGFPRQGTVVVVILVSALLLVRRRVEGEALSLAVRS